MAKSGGTKKGKKVTKKHKFTLAHKYSAGLSLVCFVVVCIAGVMAEARATTIAWRGMLVMLAISLVTRILVRAWASFEEMNRGEA